MPVTAGAIRKLRLDKKRAVVNLKVKTAYKAAVAGVRRKPTEKNLKVAFSRLDRAVGARVIARNKAARLKSRLSGLVK